MEAKGIVDQATVVKDSLQLMKTNLIAEAEETQNPGLKNELTKLHDRIQLLEDDQRKTDSQRQEEHDRILEDYSRLTGKANKKENLWI